MENRPICWKLRLSGIKEAGSPNEAQQNSKPQQRIPERFPAKSSISHNKSANFSYPVFSQESQFFTGGLILPIFRAKWRFPNWAQAIKIVPNQKKKKTKLLSLQKLYFPRPNPLLRDDGEKEEMGSVPFPLSCLEIAEASSRNKKPFYGGNDPSQNKICS